MFFARTLSSIFANLTGCGRHFALALLLLLLCQLTNYAAIVNATLDLPAAELLQHAQQNVENYAKTGGDTGGESDVHHSSAYKQLMSHAFDAYELPPSVEDEQVYDDSAELTDLVQDVGPKAKQAIMAAAFPPAAASALFMQLHNEQKQQKQQQQQQQLPHHMHKSSAAKVHHQQQQQQRRPCNIEISTKIPGFCQPMQSIGSACVSGEYMDVFSLDCI